MLCKHLCIISAGLIAFSCTSPTTIHPIPNANISAQDRADIAGLASHFSTRTIDSISISHFHYYELVPYRDTATDFYGFVHFDSTYSDTDAVSYQDLYFYNRYWSSFNTDTAYDSTRVFVHDWYSESKCLYSYEKRIFKIDTITVITRTDSIINKPLIAHVLSLIQENQFTKKDTSLHFTEKLADLNYVNVSVRNDSTTFSLGFGSGNPTFLFSYFAGALEFSGIEMLIY
jgi:hypothetical protein